MAAGEVVMQAPRGQCQLRAHPCQQAPRSVEEPVMCGALAGAMARIGGGGGDLDPVTHPLAASERMGRWVEVADERRAG